MKVLLQRVNFATVESEGKVTGKIERGYVLLTGFGQGDNEKVLLPMAQKIAHLRIFPDENGRFHHSLIDLKGGALVIPQFTLYADTSKGRRPEFFQALAPDPARELCQKFAAALKAQGIDPVFEGVFGAHMKVALENDGPVTILLEM